jgi:hypothetical protein
MVHSHLEAQLSDSTHLHVARTRECCSQRNCWLLGRIASYKKDLNEAMYTHHDFVEFFHD